MGEADGETTVLAPDPTRTRAREMAERREVGVAYIVEEMRGGRWYSTRTDEIAKRYGVCFKTAAEWAGEAGRQSRALSALDAEAQRAILVARLELHEQAAGTGSKEAIAAIKAVADIEGLTADARAKADEYVSAFLSAYFEVLHERLAPEAYQAAIDAVETARARAATKRLR